MSPKRYVKETRRCARAMVRACGSDPDAMVMPSPETFAQMRAGLLPPGVRVQAWQNHAAQAAGILDGMLGNPECAAVLASPGKIAWHFTTETTP